LRRDIHPQNKEGGPLAAGISCGKFGYFVSSRMNFFKNHVIALLTPEKSYYFGVASSLLSFG
jgi:hypothetical protein